MKKWFVFLNEARLFFFIIWCKIQICSHLFKTVITSLWIRILFMLFVCHFFLIFTLPYLFLISDILCVQNKKHFLKMFDCSNILVLRSTNFVHKKNLWWNIYFELWHWFGKFNQAIDVPIFSNNTKKNLAVIRNKCGSSKLSIIYLKNKNSHAK